MIVDIVISRNFKDCGGIKLFRLIFVDGGWLHFEWRNGGWLLISVKMS